MYAFYTFMVVGITRSAVIAEFFSCMIGGIILESRFNEHMRKYHP